MGGRRGLGPFEKPTPSIFSANKMARKIRIPFHYKKAVAGKAKTLPLQPGDVWSYLDGMLLGFAL